MKQRQMNKEREKEEDAFSSVEFWVGELDPVVVLFFCKGICIWSEIFLHIL